jgi:hypothetical protein
VLQKLFRSDALNSGREIDQFLPITLRLAPLAPVRLPGPQAAAIPAGPAAATLGRGRKNTRRPTATITTVAISAIVRREKLERTPITLYHIHRLRSSFGIRSA